MSRVVPVNSRMLSVHFQFNVFSVLIEKLCKIQLQRVTREILAVPDDYDHIIARFHVHRDQ